MSRPMCQLTYRPVYRSIYRLTLDRVSVDTWLTCRSIFVSLSVNTQLAPQLAVYQSTVGGISVNWRWYSVFC